QLLPATTRLVLYSSAAGTLGTPGQGNYAAANAFLDALAHLRPNTVSVGWGLWAPTSGITGQLGDADQQRLARAGVRPLGTEHGHRLLDAALATGGRHYVAADLDLKGVRAGGAVPPLLRGLVPAGVRPRRGAGERVSITARLAGQGRAEQSRLLLDLVRSNIAVVLGHAQPDTVDVERGFLDMGFDSLTALELRNQLRDATGLPLPATAMFDFPTPVAIVRYLHGQLVPAAEPDGDPHEAAIRRTLAGIPLARLRAAGLLDVLLGLAGGADAAPEPAADGAQAIADADVDDLINLALTTTTES
ncbi:beta-ketoacyl reductase, partial [Dactylosporangium sp. NPDC051541]|uniref:beta-ketoacyl reductase n=1 Tax=Dactylosporangium sp. NPDC051541 TaxID=3363977 RepID=UPI0037B8F795